MQGYNAQAAVDIDSHLIVAEHVSEHTNDKQELAPALRCLDERQEVVGHSTDMPGPARASHANPIVPTPFSSP